jgi:hypothetical protein
MWIYLVYFRVIALDLVKIYYFELVSHVTQKVFHLVSWNFIEMVHLGIFMWIYLVILELCPWLSKNLQFSTCVAHMSKKHLTWSHETLKECWSACVVVHLGIFVWIYLVILELCPWLIKNLQFSTCVAHMSKSIWPGVMKR